MIIQKALESHRAYAHNDNKREKREKKEKKIIVKDGG
jgi:hypothetical protein